MAKRESDVKTQTRNESAKTLCWNENFVYILSISLRTSQCCLSLARSPKICDLFFFRNRVLRYCIEIEIIIPLWTKQHRNREKMAAELHPFFHLMAVWLHLLKNSPPFSTLCLTLCVGDIINEPPVDVLYSKQKTISLIDRFWYQTKACFIASSWTCQCVPSLYFWQGVN